MKCLLLLLLLRSLKCSLDEAKRGFVRATNAIFGKIGRVASEEVVLELVKYKCLPILLYSLECCPLNKSDVKSLDFAVTRFLMKLFKSVNLDLLTNVGSVSTFRSLANC